MTTKESARCVIEAYSLKFEFQLFTKKLKPWDSRAEKYIVTLNKMLDELKKKRMKDLELNMLGYDEVGYYDYDDWRTNVADGVFCSEALNNCWDKFE